MRVLRTWNKFWRQLPLFAMVPFFNFGGLPSHFNVPMHGKINLVARHTAHSKALRNTLKPLAELSPLQQITDCHKMACVALTFDDGPNPVTTPDVLNALEAAHVPASFFLVGSRVPGNEGLLQRMHADGYEIGNHTYNHVDLTKLPPDQISQQIIQTQQVIAAAGVPAPTILRPPDGAINPTVEQVANMSILLWNADPKDWAATSPAQVVQSVEAGARPGAVIDMHDIYHATANALPQIITDLQARGLHFVTVSQLLDLTPASRGIYYGHPPQP